MSDSKRLRKNKLMPKAQPDSFVELKQLELQITQEEEEINEILNITNKPGELTFDIKVEVEQIDEDENESFYTRPPDADFAPRLLSDSEPGPKPLSNKDPEIRQPSVKVPETNLSFNKYFEPSLSSDDDAEPMLVIDDEPPITKTTETAPKDTQNSEVSCTKPDTERETILCDLCGINVKQSELQEHILNFHPNNTDLLFTKENNFNKSILILYSNKTEDNVKPSKLQCTDCKLVFKLRGLWRSHFLKHYYTCITCGKYYDTCLHLHRHASECKGVKRIDTTSLVGELIFYRCTICRRLFSQENDLDEHLSEVHVPSSRYLMPARIIKCLSCRLPYAASSVAHYCSKRKNKFFCKFCKKGFKNRLFFMAHCLAYLKKTIGINCKKCNFKFENECQITQHDCEYTHSYQCKLCESEFFVEEAIEEHVINIHKMENYFLTRLYYFKKKTACFSEKIPEIGSKVKCTKGLLINNKDDKVMSPGTDNKIQTKIQDKIDDVDVTSNADVASEDDVEIVEDEYEIIDVDEETENGAETTSNTKPHTVTEILNDAISKVKIKLDPDDESHEVDVTTVNDSFSSEEVLVGPKSDEFEDDIIILNKEEKFMNVVKNIKENTTNEGVQSVTKCKRNDKLYKCSHCFYKGIHKDYANHNCEFIRKKHIYKKEKNNYKCIYCHFIGRNRDLKIHNKTCYKRAAKIMPGSSERTDLNCTKCKNRFNVTDESLSLLRCSYCNIYNCCYCYFETAIYEDYRAHIECHLMVNFLKITSFNQSTFLNRRNSYKCKTCKKNFKINEVKDHWSLHVREFTEIDTICAVPQIKQEPSDAEIRPELSKEKLEEVLKSLLYASGHKPCNVCHKFFSRRTDYKRHLVEHLLSDAYSKKDKYQSLVCQICSLSADSEAGYKLHMREHASLTTYKCPLCHKHFSDSSNFSKHKKMHNQTVLICDLCGRRFTGKTQLICHLEKHNNSEPIKCVLCEKEFSFLSGFWKHVKMVHVKTIFRHKCPICKLKFSCLKDKWDHQWLVHKERKVAADCQLCGQSYRKISDLKKHVRNCMVMMEDLGADVDL